MEFEWDEKKNRLNIENHRVDFETASAVFLDEFRLDFPDEDHSEQEERRITIGMVNSLFFRCLYGKGREH